MMKNTLFVFLLLLSSTGFSQSATQTITGRVTDLGQPLVNANVSVKGTDNGTNTDAKGNYTIKAKPRDVLVFSYVGMRTVEIIVEDVTSILNVKLAPEVEELDEVVVEKKKGRIQRNLDLEYDTNKDLVRSAHGMLDKRRSGFSMRIFDEEDIWPSARNFMEVIQGRFHGRIANGNIYLRPTPTLLRGTPATIYDLDGAITIDAPTFIPASEIKRIAIIQGSSAYARYGPQAAGGVIIINTKRGSMHREPGLDEPYDRAKLRNNIFDEASVKGNYVAEPPAFLMEIYDSESEARALEVFKSKKDLYDDSPYYLLDIGTYFLNKWKDRTKAWELFSMIQDNFPENAPALKALAYVYQENRDWEAARDVYIKVFKLRPRYAQSYRDLANAYSEAGDLDRGLIFYGRYMAAHKTDNRAGQLQGIDSIIKVEAGNLLYTSSDTRTSKNELQHNLGIWPIRILVEWNSSEAEFDLQFVHPSKHYFTWNHTLEDNPERIKDEKLRGYSSEQFMIDNSATGQWLINLKYFGNRSYDPTYLKVTTYRDYGTTSQKKEIKVFELTEKNVNQTLLELYTSGPQASN
ncbi:carboxypeptidase-like regulatory domain-containing protein [Flavobacteriaceae bacterium F89]|uniref:Carboxypeptidase-like regulatory domain-containing protein n=1 Tax=Cerina litoralis TaxID=2874477 RepID=A0AAE3EX01_9FLAO|nr:carboxypeptidase-like regulatory domain-containing protein [Cerina litoralis]MCG2461276.1 carboxypeptidase-like regulatory domain-containing protein [Cerina litoralis]